MTNCSFCQEKSTKRDNIFRPKTFCQRFDNSLFLAVVNGNRAELKTDRHGNSITGDQECLAVEGILPSLCTREKTTLVLG